MARDCCICEQALYIPTVPYYAVLLTVFSCCFFSILLGIIAALTALFNQGLIREDARWGIDLFGLGYGWTGLKENAFTDGTPKGIRGYDVLDRRNFVGNKRHCKNEGRELPTFSSQYQENAFINVIRKPKKNITCDAFFLGYHISDEGVLYHNLKLTKTWRSLKVGDYRSAQPSSREKRDCQQFLWGHTRFGETADCRKFNKMRCAVGLVQHEDKCRKKPFHKDCIRHMTATPRNLYRFHRLMNFTMKNYRGIALVDKNWHPYPKTVWDEVSMARTPECYAYAVIINATWINTYTRKKPTYKSNRFLRGDPDDWCWMMNATDGYSIRLIDCDVKLCAVCI